MHADMLKYFVHVFLHFFRTMIRPFLFSNGFAQYSPSDPCPTDLDRILMEGQDPGAQQYLVLGTVPIKGKKPGVLGAHAFFVLSTVPIKKKRLQVKPKANKLYKEALEQCNHNNHVSKFI